MAKWTLGIVAALLGAASLLAVDAGLLSARADDDKTTASELETLEGKLESQCGADDNSVGVESYQPIATRAWHPTVAFVRGEEPSTAILWWRDFAREAKQDVVSSGTVNKRSWCSGTLIRADLYLTAAHCLRIETGKIVDGSRTHVTPFKTVGADRKYLEPKDYLKYMSVYFNYQTQAEPHSENVGPVSEYPVLAIVEHGDKIGKFKNTSLDYAILRLGPGVDGKLPGERFPIANMDSRRTTLDAAKMLTIVQHPAGKPKRVDGGERCFKSSAACSYEANSDRSIAIYYDDIDTLGGTSGSGIIDENGAVIGVHTNGGCKRVVGGANRGYSLYSISQVSEIVPKQR